MELMLREKPCPREGKPVRFSGVVSFLKREIHFNFEFSLYIKRKTLGEKQ